MSNPFSFSERFAFISLCTAAGAVNVIGLISASNLSLSHMTGNVSESAIAFSQGNINLGLQILSLIFAFVLGAAISGFFSTSNAAKTTILSKLLFIEAGLLLISLTGFYLHFIIGAFISSIACGLQNAALANYASSWLRTTHLTGTLSDIGNKLGGLASKSDIDRPKFKLQLLLLFCFLSGGIFSSIAFSTYQYLSILPAAAIIAMCAVFFTFRSFKT